MSKTMRTLTLTGILATLLLTTGCLEGSAVRTGAYLPPRPSYAPVDVYLHHDPPYAWEEVGHVSASGSGYHATMTDVLAVMKDQARDLGADAIIVTDTWEEEEIWYDEYGWEHVRVHLHSEGIAIYYL